MRLYLYVILSFFLRLPTYAPLERELERMLMESVPGLDEAKVSLRTPRWKFLFMGLFERVNVELRGLEVGGGLRLDRMCAAGQYVRVFPWLTFFLGHARLRSAGEIIWNFSIGQEDLEKFFAGKGPILRGTKVSITPECITLRRGMGLAGALLDIGEPLCLVGKLEVREDANIHLDLHQVKAFGISPGRSLLGPIMGLINPVVRSTDLNRTLKKISVDVLEGLVLHNRFMEISLYAGCAEVHSELFVMKKKPRPAGGPEPEENRAD